MVVAKTGTKRRNRNGAMRLWLTMGLAIPTMLSEPAAASRMEVLGYSIEANITPSLAKLQARLKLSDAQLQKMLVAMPAVLFEKNLGPKLDWLQHELQLSTADLRARVLAAPAILGYSLERRYRPRLRVCRDAGVDSMAVLTRIAMSDERFCKSIGVDAYALEQYLR